MKSFNKLIQNIHDTVSVDLMDFNNFKGTEGEKLTKLCGTRLKDFLPKLYTAKYWYQLCFVFVETDISFNM